MSTGNDYEYLGDSQTTAPPPVAPRAPDNAHPDLKTSSGTGLPHTPALTAKDDVSLESNRPSKNNLSFSDMHVNPKRSQPSVATTTKSHSADSDVEKGAAAAKETKPAKKSKMPERNKGGCCCVFAAITICLAVIALLGLGAMFLFNVSDTVADNGNSTTVATVSSTPVSSLPTVKDKSAKLFGAATISNRNTTASTALTSTSRPSTTAAAATTVTSTEKPTTSVRANTTTQATTTPEASPATITEQELSTTSPVAVNVTGMQMNQTSTSGTTEEMSTSPMPTTTTNSTVVAITSTSMALNETTSETLAPALTTAINATINIATSSAAPTMIAPNGTTVAKTTAADSSIENALGDEPTLSVHSLNRAICVLIAKVDRFYSQVCRELCLPALHDLCVAIVSSSENRVFYSAQKHIHLTAPVSLLSRISDIISTLSHRPLIHQMFIYPLVSAHFVKVCQCDQESRIAATALAEVATRLLVTETPGLCFNQTLIVPFQTASCSESCSDETKEQMLCALSQLVLSQADKIGSGWKPLFGSLKAVSAARDEKVHWCAIDVISSYLRIDSPPVLSFSILECVPCVVNLLQNSEDSSEVSTAALRLLPNIYSLILYLYSTPHIPNYHLLHRSDLRSKCLDTVELDLDHDPVTVPHGPLPWDDKQTYEIAAVELFLTFMDQICGTLLTSSPTTQKNLLDMIGRLLVDISNKPLGAESGGVCMSAVILPYVQKWIRRPDVEEVRILKQVVGACTQTVIDMVELEQMSPWFDRLLRDICALIVECVLFDKTCAVAPAYFTLIANNSSRFSTEQWKIFSHFLAYASTQSLRHIRLLNSFFVRSSTDENGDIGEVTSYNPGKLTFQQLIAAAQVFSSKREKLEEEEDLSSGVALLMLSHGADTHRLEVSSIVSSLFTHCLFLQLLASLLISEEDPKLKASLIGSASPINPKLDESIYPALYGILTESSETSTDFDSRPAVGSLLSRMLGIQHANLLKMLVSSNLIHSMSLLRRFEQTKDTKVLLEVAKAVKQRSVDLKSVEFEVSTRRSALVGREHAITQYHLVPVENGEDNAYRLVSQDFVNDTLSEYDKHRDRLKPFVPDRRNPFQQAIDDLDPSITTTELEKKEDFDEIRLAAHRDICLIPLRHVADGLLREHLPDFLPAITQVVLASPDLAVRQLSVDFMARLA